MIEARFLIVLVAGWTIFRTLVRIFGYQKPKIGMFDLIFLLVGCFIVIYLTRTLVFVAIPIFFSVLNLIFRKYSFKKQQRSTLTYVDDVLMTMRAGYSIDSAIKICANQNANTMNSTNGQLATDPEFLKIVAFCHQSPTMSFKILSTFQKTLRLKEKLYLKQQNLSLQAKAQSIVSVLVFLLLMTTQFKLNPDFSTFLTKPLGRFLFVASILWLFVGVRLVFKFSQPKELNL